MKIIEIRKNQLIELCQYLINEYSHILTSKELEIVEEIYSYIGKIDIINFELVNKLTNLFSPIVEKVWKEELKSGDFVIVSWNKYANKSTKDAITFATLSKRNEIISFCNLTEGIEYEIDYSSIIGCLDKDGATLIEDKTKNGEYTIGTINDKVINSYNGATKLITPKQLVAKTNNEYYTNYNELILYSALIKEIGPYKIDDLKRIK